MLDKLYGMQAKKGFTLVEIIVVLVILAILAAASIPTMLGFVEDARAKSLITEARAIRVALRTITLNAYMGTRHTEYDAVTNPWGNTAVFNSAGVTGQIRGYSGYPKTAPTYLAEINRLTGQEYTKDNFEGNLNFAPASENNGEVDKFIFTKNGIRIQYDRKVGFTVLK